MPITDALDDSAITTSVACLITKPSPWMILKFRILMSTSSSSFPVCAASAGLPAGVIGLTTCRLGCVLGSLVFGQPTPSTELTLVKESSPSARGWDALLLLSRSVPNAHPGRCDSPDRLPLGVAGLDR